MALDIQEINSNSTIENIDNNFKAIKQKINDKTLAFHYLNLYNLKGSVNGTPNEITAAYNLLNLNEGRLIIEADEGVTWKTLNLQTGDYIVKTTSGPVKIPGPKTGYYIPAVNENGILSFTYQNTPAQTLPAARDITGATGAGYQFTTEISSVATASPVTLCAAQAGITPIIQFYTSDNSRIDLPYSLNTPEVSQNWILTFSGFATAWTTNIRIVVR